jgi:hypothetical protein
VSTEFTESCKKIMKLHSQIYQLSHLSSRLGDIGNNVYCDMKTAKYTAVKNTESQARLLYLCFAIGDPLQMYWFHDPLSLCEFVTVIWTELFHYMVPTAKIM